MHEGRGRPWTAESNSLPPKRNHTMLVVAFSLLLGIWIAPELSVGPWPWVLIALCVPLAYSLRRLGLRPHLAIGLLLFALGILWAQVWLTPAAPDPGSYHIHGRVFGDPVQRTESRMTFVLGQVMLDGVAQESKAYCTLYTYGEEPLPSLFDGAEVDCEGYAYLPQGKSGPHDFDYRMWLYQSRISYGIASIRGLRVLNTQAEAPWYDWAARIRRAMRAALRRVMGEESGLAMAMLVNDREGMRQDELEAFQRTGIAHVISVSGLHVAIVGGMILWVLGKIRVRRGGQLLVLVVCLAGYCLLSGFSAACVRAAVMLLIAAATRMLRRRYDPLITLCTALTVVLLLNPLQLFSAGFVLSFTAMGGILLLYPRFIALLGRGTRRRKERRARPRHEDQAFWQRSLRSLWRRVSELLALSLSAQLGVLLPTAAYFHQLPLYGLLINLWVVPLVGFLIPLYFVTLGATLIPFVGEGVGFLAKQLTHWLIQSIRLLSVLSYAVIRVPSAPPFVLCGAVVCVVLVSWYFRGKAKTRLLALGLACAVMAVGAYATRPQDLRYIQLSVGQADAALLLDGDQTVAVDVGEFGDAVSGYLLAEGRNLDAVYLTHLHLDHALGMQDILDAGIAIGKVYLPVKGAEQWIGQEALGMLERLRFMGIPIQELAAGEELRYNKASVLVLWPRREAVRPLQDANHTSMALRIDFGGYGILTAGDLTGRYEDYAAVPCDVLKVAHHGSAESTAAEFLDFVAPKLALISCAAGDRLLPAAETLLRLRERKIPVFRTDEGGDLTLTLQGGQLRLTTYKARTQQ